MKITEFAIDKNLSEEGIWVDISDDARIKVASVKTDRYKRRLAELSAPYRHMITTRTEAAQKKISEITARAIADVIIINWEGIQNNDGEEIPYSRDTAYKLLKDYPAFADMVYAIASDDAVFKPSVIEEDKKN